MLSSQSPPSPITLYPPQQIVLSPDYEPMVKDLEAAFAKQWKLRGEPLIYQRSRSLMVIGQGEPTPEWLIRPPNGAVIVRAAPEHVMKLASMAATFTRYDKKQKKDVAVEPPMKLIKTLMAEPDFPFPVLNGIVHVPTLCPNGEVITDEGYHQQTHLYVDFHEITFPPVPTQPTLDDARAAITRLKAVFVNFPFKGADPVAPLQTNGYRSAALAAVLSLVGRYAVNGKIPVFAVSANTPGTGKGLLIDAISTIATGRQAPCWSQTTNAEEEAKRLMTIAISADLLIHIDNITEIFGSGPLHSALTTGEITDRLLGGNVQCTLPFDTVFFLSGNNLMHRQDMVRRIVPIELYVIEEHPETRSGFQHADLLAWVLDQRPALVIDAITVLAAYIQAGRPMKTQTGLGSFQAWSDLVRNALIWADETDPCEGCAELQEGSNPDADALKAVLEAWYVCYPWTPQTLASVIKDIEHHNRQNIWGDLLQALAGMDQQWNGRQLNSKSVGKQLGVHRGQRLGNKRLVRLPGRQGGVVQWKVERLT